MFPRHVLHAGGQARTTAIAELEDSLTERLKGLRLTSFVGGSRCFPVGSWAAVPAGWDRLGVFEVSSFGV